MIGLSRNWALTLLNILTFPAHCVVCSMLLHQTNFWEPTTMGEKQFWTQLEKFVIICSVKWKKPAAINLDIGTNHLLISWHTYTNIFQDINHVSSLSIYLNRTFSWRNCFLRTLVNLTIMRRVNRYK